MIHRYVVEYRGEEREVTVEPLDGGRWRVTHAGRTRVVDARKVSEGPRASSWSIVPEAGGAATRVDVDGAAPDLNVTVDNVTVALKVVDARRKLAGLAAAARTASGGPLAIRSPMPGKIVKVLVKSGDEVKTGQGVVVVEAMKMENELRAPRDGKVRAIDVQEGQAVEANQALATLE